MITRVFFLYGGRCYCFKVTSFGLSTSLGLASLASGLGHVLMDEVKKNTIIYVDDVICFSQNEQEHVIHLKKLLENLKNANMTIILQKSQFFCKEIQYLGYCLTTSGIKATPDKVAAILNFPSPRNLKQLKGFLGLINFYNKFTNKYAEYTPVSYTHLVINTQNEGEIEESLLKLRKSITKVTESR